MDSESKAWCIWGCVFIMLIFGTIITLYSLDTKTEKQYIDAGYAKQNLCVQWSSKWLKAEK